MQYRITITGFLQILQTQLETYTFPEYIFRFIYYQFIKALLYQSISIVYIYENKST